MTSNEIVLPGATSLPANHRVGQGTAVEMSRAVAEVHAAMYAARQFPRDETQAVREMENSCRQTYVANKAQYRLPRSGGAVTGPTIQLAKELARCWGHIQYGVAEVLRDDVHGQSEMMALAWDVQTGTRSSSTFIVPHMRDKKNKQGKAAPEQLISMQEIYENNANNGARRLREAIFGVLPSWFTERAKELCAETREAGDGKPLTDRIDNCIAGFASLEVTVDQLERKLDLPRIRWTGHEVAFLGTVYKAIRAGETTKAEEFPRERVTVAEIAGAPPVKPTPADPDNQLRDDDPDLAGGER